MLSACPAVPTGVRKWASETLPQRGPCKKSPPATFGTLRCPENRLAAMAYSRYYFAGPTQKLVGATGASGTVIETFGTAGAWKLMCIGVPIVCICTIRERDFSSEHWAFVIERAAVSCALIMAATLILVARSTARAFISWVRRFTNSCSLCS